MRLAFVPPKPNEFVIARLIVVAAARFATRRSVLSESGASRLIVGGTI